MTTEPQRTTKPPIRPHLQSLLLANHIYQDRESGNFIIAGTFNQVQFRQEPPKMKSEQPVGELTPREKSLRELRIVGSPWLFFSLTDILGTVPCAIRYVYLLDNQILFSTQFQINSPDRLVTFEHRMQLPSLPFAGFGQYALEFFAHGEMIGSLRIMAIPDKASE